MEHYENQYQQVPKTHLKNTKSETNQINQYDKNEIVVNNIINNFLIPEESKERSYKRKYLATSTSLTREKISLPDLRSADILNKIKNRCKITNPNFLEE